MDRYIGLDAHASSCTLAVLSPSGKRLGSQVVETNARCLIDLDAGLRIDRRGHHTLVVRVDNATNRLYRDHLSRVEERGFPMPARSLAVVLSTRF